MANDPEHARLLLEARARSADKAEPYAPAMATWSVEAELLATIRDSLQQLSLITLAANSEKGHAKPKFEPYPRPRTMLEKLRHDVRRKRHEALVSRVLPKREG